MHHILDLFSGIGGLTLHFPDHTVVLYVENSPFCQQVLRARMDDGVLPVADIHADIKTLTAAHPLLRNRPVDIIVAGFPCQDISSIGTKQGFDGTRSSLIFEVLRLAVELQLPTLWLENVQRLTSLPSVWQPLFTRLQK